MKELYVESELIQCHLSQVRRHVQARPLSTPDHKVAATHKDGIKSGPLQQKANDRQEDK